MHRHSLKKQVPRMEKIKWDRLERVVVAASCPFLPCQSYQVSRYIPTLDLSPSPSVKGISKERAEVLT